MQRFSSVYLVFPILPLFYFKFTTNEIKRKEQKLENCDGFIFCSGHTYLLVWPFSFPLFLSIQFFGSEIDICFEWAGGWEDVRETNLVSVPRINTILVFTSVVHIQQQNFFHYWNVFQLLFRAMRQVHCMSVYICRFTLSCRNRICWMLKCRHFSILEFCLSHLHTLLKHKC